MAIVDRHHALVKKRKIDLYIAPHCEKLTSEAITYGSRGSNSRKYLIIKHIVDSVRNKGGVRRGQTPQKYEGPMQSCNM